MQFEEVPSSFMMEIAVYGLPVRMPHWSFGVRYIYQLVQHRMGHSRLFEVVFPGNPGRAYLAGNNSLQENTLVTGARARPRRLREEQLAVQAQPGAGRLSHRRAGGRATRARSARPSSSTARRESSRCSTRRSRSRRTSIRSRACAASAIRSTSTVRGAPHESGFQKRFDNLPGDEPRPPMRRSSARARRFRRRPSATCLWLIAEYAPELEEWERDIFRAVREESFYFYPVFACQIMNEGWASYWHARLLREADFLPHNEYLDALKTHSDVVRPHAAEQQASLVTNPYHLGFSIWESIVEEHGLERAFQIRAEDDDFSFVRNHLTQELAEELKLFRYERNADGGVRVLDHDIRRAARDGARAEIQLRRAGRAREARRQRRLADAASTSTRPTAAGSTSSGPSGSSTIIHKIWRRPIRLETIDRGQARTVARSAV